MSQDLQDLVRLATIASRINRGDLVWVSWVPGERKGSPGHGSTLLMLTTRGAAKLLLRMPTATDQAALEAADAAMEAGIPPTQMLAPGHFDLSLLASLRDDEGHRMQASYLLPPCGSYSVHPSGCDKQFGGPEGRPNGWGQPWACRGLRREEDPKDREKWLCGFSKKGKPSWITQVNISSSPDLMWKSYWEGEGQPRPKPLPPPGEPPAPGGSASSSAADRSAPTRQRPGRGEETAQQPEAASGSQDVPPRAAAHAAEASAGGVASAAAPDTQVPKATKRKRREERGHLLYRGLRLWVDRAYEAPRFPKNREAPPPATVTQTVRQQSCESSPPAPDPWPTSPHQPALALPRTSCRTLPALRSHLPWTPTLDRPGPHITRRPLACQRCPSRLPHLHPLTLPAGACHPCVFGFWIFTLLSRDTVVPATRPMSWLSLPCRWCPQSSARLATRAP